MPRRPRGWCRTACRERRTTRSSAGGRNPHLRRFPVSAPCPTSNETTSHQRCWPNLPACPHIVAATVRMHQKSLTAGIDLVDGGVKQRVDQFGVWPRADRPADGNAVEAIGHGRFLSLVPRSTRHAEIFIHCFRTCLSHAQGGESSLPDCRR